ncbi:MAG: DNA internalization-related competence protein ComEC/Rec2 [Magnetococcales bacterium]|nr:DNA internalization-related competence protein ComEC/Rec2 [Magnetococcales bacterium]
MFDWRNRLPSFEKTPAPRPSRHLPPRPTRPTLSTPIGTPALFLAWMILGILIGLPSVGEHRQALIAIALLPACAATWSRFDARMAVVLPLLSGLLWGGIVVIGSRLPDPAPLPDTPKHQITLEAVVADRDDRDDATVLLLDAVVGENWQPKGLARISLYRHKSDVHPGDRIRLTARFHPMNGARNPGAFDYRNYLLENTIVATGSTTGAIEKIGATDTWFWNRQRQRIAAWIGATLPESQRGLTEALLVGKRGHLDSALQNALYASGTFHLVAISGLHLTLIGGTTFYVVRLLLTLIVPFSRRWDLKPVAALVSLVPITVYAYLAGWTVSTQRAFIMTGLFLIAVALRRQHQSWRILTFAAILVLSWQPSQLLNAGFQLSFLCVVVILALMAHLPSRNWREKLLFALASTVAIELVTAPVTMQAFHRLSPYGLLANFLMIPWVGELSTPLGLIAMVVQPVWGWLGDGLLQLTGWSMAIYRGLIEQVVTWPGAEVRGAGPLLPGAALYVAALIVAVAIRDAGPWAWRRLLFVGVALLGLQWPRSTIPDQALRMTVLDVGQALAVLIKMPEGGWSLFDAGGTVNPRFDIGEATISTALWHHGVERLERVVLSHPQRDHMAGMARVIRNFPVGSLWTGLWSEKDEAVEMFQELMATATRRGVPVVRFQGAAALREGAGMIRMLPPMDATSKASLNDRSQAMEIRHGDHAFLLTGDMEAREESWLISRRALGPVSVLIVPHHGSRTSSTPNFVQTTRPEHAVISVGATNPWGFPKPEVVRRWEAVGARIWRTDRQGAVSFTSDGQRLEVTTAE